MYTVIKNDFLMHPRSNRRLAATRRDFHEHQAGANGLEEFETFHLRQVIQTALETLPIDQRECVVLVDLKGMDYQEAAGILEIPVGTVRSRLSRARAKLAARLHFLEKSR